MDELAEVPFPIADRLRLAVLGGDPQKPRRVSHASASHGPGGLRGGLGLLVLLLQRTPVVDWDDSHESPEGCVPISRISRAFRLPV